MVSFHEDIWDLDSERDRGRKCSFSSVDSTKALRGPSDEPVLMPADQCPVRPAIPRPD